MKFGYFKTNFKAFVSWPKTFLAFILAIKIDFVIHIETFILKDRIEFQDREALKVFEKLKNKKNYQFFVKMDESGLKKKRVENVPLLKLTSLFTRW